MKQFTEDENSQISDSNLIILDGEEKQVVIEGDEDVPTVTPFVYFLLATLAFILVSLT